MRKLETLMEFKKYKNSSSRFVPYLTCSSSILINVNADRWGDGEDGNVL